MRIMVVLGTRPEGIKFAPIIHSLEGTSELECITVNTGQHREMLDQVLQLFQVKPMYDLHLMSNNQSLEALTGLMIERVSQVVRKENPDLVMVLGDTATTFAGAYAAFLQKVPVAHVEAGLRTKLIYSPFPEEMYRQLVTRLSSIHFAPTQLNKQNLIAENIPEEHIAVVGNSVIDALLDVTTRSFTLPPDLQQIVSKRNRIILVTTHRRENFDQLSGVYKALHHLIQEFEDIDIIFPVHRNPRVRMEVAVHLPDDQRLHLVEPLDYECFVHIMKRATFILTDSGGIQEEAPALGVPVLVVRESTERPEGISAGTLRVVGTRQENIVAEGRRILSDPGEYNKMAKARNPYGDGLTSQRITSFMIANMDWIKGLKRG